MHHGTRPLRAQLFRWFAAAIVVSMALGLGAGWLLKELRKREGHEEHPVEQFVTARVADEWQVPAERQRILRDAAEHLCWGVSLTDTAGRVVEQSGQVCPEAFLTLPVQDSNGQVLGNLTFCAPRMGPGLGHGPHGPSAGPGGPPQRRYVVTASFLMLMLLAMWWASGRVARLLAKPLQDLATVADDLGQGRLSSRAQLATRGHRVTELDSLAHSINDMAERIERQMHDQKELLAAVSHELRTPLGHAKLLTEMIRDGHETAKSVDDLELELAELERMVGQLLASARLDFTAIAPQPLDPVQLAVRVLERAGVDAMVLAMDAPDVRIAADAALLAQALANLVDNARRHGGQLHTLRLSLEGDIFWFDAIDNGPGFNDDEASTAFEPFRRGPASHGGLGLGLALVRRIALAHAGQVRARNQPERGACVGIGVPVIFQSP